MLKCLIDISAVPIWKSILLIGAIILVKACVSPLSLTGSACPCEEPYRCCPFINQCYPTNQMCPAELQPSSQKPCLHNEDCPAEEICQSWTRINVVMGPQECRKACDLEQSRCAENEICKNTAQDGLSIITGNVAPMCISKNWDIACTGWECKECPLGKAGKMYCKGNELHACFSSVHPICGIHCTDQLLATCKTCEEDDEAASCKVDNSISDTFKLCSEYNCQSCDSNTVSSCDKGGITTCASVQYNANECQTLCLSRKIAQCEYGCSTNPQNLASCNTDTQQLP